MSCSGVLTLNATNETFIHESTAFQQDLKDLKFVAYGICGSIVLSFGIVGNIFNLIVLTRPSLQHGITYTYLTWLAISDLLTMVTCAPFLLRLQDVQWHSYVAATYFSHVELPIVNALMASSVFLVVALTVDRYFSVCHPARFKEVHNTTHAKKAICWAYVVAFVVYIPICFEKIPVQVGNDGKFFIACENPYVVNHVVYKAYLLIKESMVRVGPVVILLMLNVSIIFSFYRRRQKLICRSRSFRKKTRNEHRLVVLLAAIVVMFFVCMTPAAVLTLLHSEDKDMHYKFQVFRAVANVLELCNYAMNFYLYCMCSPEIRVTLLQLFKCRKTKQELFL